MTKSPRRVAREALALARQALPAYACPTSRHDFTQAQLFAILALKTFLKTDYRGVVAFVQDFPALQADLGLSRVPHYSTLCYAEPRLPTHKNHRLVRRAGRWWLPHRTFPPNSLARTTPPRGPFFAFVLYFFIVLA